MDPDQELITQIDELFHAESVAVVGVPREMEAGKVLLTALLDQGFPGRIYPVNPRAHEIEGLRAYPSVSDIPGQVDLAIVLVPPRNALGVVKECAAKGVKGVVLFAAGYSETGTEEGRALEAELVQAARAAGMRLIGPNGMGLYSPRTGLSFYPQMSKDPGSVGMISHSGSLTNILGRIASQKGIRFSKIVSLGNECDLSAADFLTYLGQDLDTHLIGAYLEGINDGPCFLKALKRASLEKPVILWKVGLTSEGSRASASHTGALAGSRESWQAAVRQGGAIPVVGFEAFTDALMGFSLLPANIGRRLAIISGAGGMAVPASEACGGEGFSLAELSEHTRSELAKFVPATGTSVRNPIDLGMTAHFDLSIFERAAATVAADPGVDTMVVIGCGLTPGDNQIFANSMIRVQQEFRKPLLIVRIPGFAHNLGPRFFEAGVPFFDSAERAMHTYALVRQYQCWRQGR